MINFNGQIIAQSEEKIPLTDRAFQYGDGFFETIIASKDKIRLYEYHWERITYSLRVLRMSCNLSVNQLKQEILDLIAHHDSEDSFFRVKVIFWRKAGGLYTPSGTDSNYAIIATHTAFSLQKPDVKKVGISKNIINHYDASSAIKSISSLPYVLCGIEKNERALEEIIITDTNGYISEASAANLIWFDNNQFFTPHLETGCVNGVSRRFFIKALHQKGYLLNEVKHRIEDFTDQTELYNINVSGLQQILQVEDRPMATTRNGYEILHVLFADV